LPSASSRRKSAPDEAPCSAFIDQDDAFAAKIEAAIDTLKTTPNTGSLRDEIAPGIRAIPAGRKAVVVFPVEDDAGEGLICAVPYGGADWIRLMGARSR
jgi:plasmid stabilization system protein ParE